MKDVVVVGGGPVGAKASTILAERGFSVVILEEHKEIGRPVHCAGLVSLRTHEMLGRPRILQELGAVRVHSPLGHVLEARAGETRAVVIDRQEADKEMVAGAVKAGAELRLGMQVLGVEAETGRIAVKVKGGEIESRLVVGADGASSVIRRCLGMEPPAELLPAFECDVSVADGSDMRTVDVWIGNKLAPGFFAWSIPAGDVMRVGLAVWQGFEAREYLNNLMSHIGISQKRVLATYAGLLPIGQIKQPFSERILLVGDAAGHVKPMTGGGLYPGMVAADVCAGIAAKALENDKLDSRSLSAYGKSLNNALGSEISKAGTLRSIFNSMDDEALDKALKNMSKPSAVEYINATGDIDFPSRLAKGLLAKCPGLLGLAPRALKSLL